MNDKVCNVLFICTGNSARSIFAEALMRHLGRGRFRVFSAGSHPKGEVAPQALAILEQWRIPTDGLRSKSWDEFSGPGAPALDFVFTVCDAAAGEVCPVWQGQPMTAHWGVPDPAAVDGTDAQKDKAFTDAAMVLKRRIELMLALPMDRLAGLSLERELDRIGHAGA